MHETYHESDENTYKYRSTMAQPQNDISAVTQPRILQIDTTEPSNYLNTNQNANRVTQIGLGVAQGRIELHGAQRGSTVRPGRARGKRGNGYSAHETEVLLELLEQFEPIGSAEWDHVHRLHNNRFPDMDRTVESLRRKLAELYRKRTPTGDPVIHPHVQRAKRIKSSVTEQADITDLTVSDTQLIGSAGEEIERESNDTSDSPSQRKLEATRRGPGSAKASVRSPCTFVRKRNPSVHASSHMSEIIELYKLQLLQEAERRNEERERRKIEKEEEKSEGSMSEKKTLDVGRLK